MERTAKVMRADAAWRDLRENLSFFTRLPVAASHGVPDFARIAWAAPLAGAVVGALGSLAFLVGQWLDLPTLVSAVLAVGTEILVTGALHEDGLADIADGFGGGATRERKLEILRDSRLGTYGVLALIFSSMLRVFALLSLSRAAGSFACAGLVLAAAAARAGALAPLVFLDPARRDGAGASAGRLPTVALRSAATTTLLLAAALGLLWLGLVRALFACVIAAAANFLVLRLADRHIGGQTGDVAGAAALVTEVTALIALLIGGRAA